MATRIWLEFNLLNNFGRASPKKIQAKFHQDWPNGLGDVLRNCGRQMTDMERSQKLTMSTLCSGELKSQNGTRFQVKIEHSDA